MTDLNFLRGSVILFLLLFFLSCYSATAASIEQPKAMPQSPSLTKLSNYNDLNNDASSDLVTSEDALNLLDKMSKAIANKNYELVFINGSNIGFETMNYMHGISEGQSLAKLIYMEGTPRAITQKGNSVSYFEQGAQNYSLSAQHIVDGLPAIFYADFKKLKEYYSFTIVGYGRTANKNCILIRMLDKENVRYTQLIWIDEQTSLPLRIDYIDQTGQVVEQFKVAKEQIFNTLPVALQKVSQANFPPLLPAIKNDTKTNPDWKLTWLPDGMVKRSCFVTTTSDTSSNGSSDGTSLPISSCYFSDGMYSFTLNISHNTEQTENIQNLVKGIRLIHVESEEGYQVILIGNLPINTTEKVIEGLSFPH